VVLLSTKAAWLSLHLCAFLTVRCRQVCLSANMLVRALLQTSLVLWLVQNTIQGGKLDASSKVLVEEA